MRLQGFGTKGIAGDLSAGLSKSIDAVAGGMGNAVLAGVNPVHGLYTVLAATPVGALFTSSVFMNIDSTGALAATAGSMLLAYPFEQRSAALVVLTLLTGVLMLAAGLLNLGFLTRFISNAVLRGFITGIGVNIVLGQLGDFTGYASTFSNKVVKGIDTLLHVTQWHWPTFLVGMVTVLLILLLDRTRLNKFSLLIALVAASLLVPLLNLTDVPLVSSLGPLPDTLPRPVLPDLTLIPGLVAPAFALAIIALAQGAGTSQAYANPDGKYPNTSRDFTGPGAANIAGAFFGGLPAGGSLGGTALLVKGGAVALGQHLHGPLCRHHHSALRHAGRQDRHAGTGRVAHRRRLSDDQLRRHSQDRAHERSLAGDDGHHLCCHRDRTAAMGNFPWRRVVVYSLCLSGIGGSDHCGDGHDRWRFPRPAARPCHTP